MDSHKYTTDSGTEFHILGDRGVIIKNADGSTAGLSEQSLSDLIAYYSGVGWNPAFNMKHNVKINALDPILMSHIKEIGLIDIINQALDHFPELHNKIIHIGVLVDARKGCFADVDPYNNVIRFNIDALKDAGNVDGWNTIIFHELMHIVQVLSNTPKTEEHCSIHAMARMPNHLVDADEVTYVGDGDRAHNADICRKAVKYRKSGKRGYIKYAKALLDEVAKNSQYDDANDDYSLQLEFVNIDEQ